MSKIKELLKTVNTGGEEVSKHDMESSKSGGFINEGGVYPVTIKKAFISQTKKKGLQLDLHFGGANIFETTLYIVSNKNGKLVTTCSMQGKTVSLPSYKLFVQIFFLATGKALTLEEMNLKTETIKYKKFGKDIELEADTVVDLIGKELQIGVRLEEKYNYEDGQEDRTSLRTNNDGDIIYDKSLEYVFNKDGFSTQELIEEASEAKDIKSTIAFLTGEKGIKRVKLEAGDNDFDDIAEKEQSADEDETIDF